MNKHIVYNFVLIFIIIQCVESQDNNPDQPADDEEDEDNFDVLDLEQIIQQRLSRFDDPQYQPQYQQLQESQYPTQPETQPQHYDYYQPELQGYHSELSYYQPQHQYYPGYQPESQGYQPEYQYYQPQPYGQYQPYEIQIQTQEPIPYYVPPQQPGQYYIPPVTQPTQQPSYQNYYPGYPPHQPSYQHQHYEPPVTQPAQQQQYYQPSQPTQTQPQLPQPQYEYYEPSHPSHTTQPQHQYYEPPQTYQPQQYYQPTTAPPPQPQLPQQQYEYYQPTTAPQTSQPEQQHYYEPTTTQTQQPEQYYDPSHPTQQQHYYEPPHTQTEVIQSEPQSPQTQSETVEDDDNFYVTEHDQPQHYVPPHTQVTKAKQPTGTQAEVIQVQQIDDEEKEKKRQQRAKLLEKLKRKIQRPDKTKPSKQQTAQPRKRKRPQTTSGDQGEEEEDEEEPIEIQSIVPIRKSSVIKLFKKDSSENLVEMTDKDYVITFDDSHKRKYKFKAYLEQIECNNEVIYVHTSGTPPYCFSLTHSKKTHIIIITKSQGFTLVRKVNGEWTRTDANIPDYVKFYKRDSGGNEVLITNNEYNIDFTSLRSFRYTFLPGTRCHKVQVKGVIAWKKTEDDDNFPEIIYVTPKFGVILKFKKYTKVFEKRGNTYQYLRTNKNLIKAKYR
ncbi:SVSP family protein [Theileria parva strain Muguga]|uniref:Theileria-specific sub-telomeric protein, SVSP family n=1 Tax=Theileria parva TaxID=5875 RepID=Q4MYF6_THEPA|nr:SVSP family protein [Theileria parva strain Muguga]XP_763009.1 SVSP family protein [Theileria parva strain Muguga]EAN30713.1 SVSP family protein [Theileria parva strain Muguga]EAN30726.1 SVSP family protein [Theileria parva strain Muguga]|eukprot:XP_762996.1 hypothetical protein [Theileria parva strain Muguga]